MNKIRILLRSKFFYFSVGFGILLGSSTYFAFSNAPTRIPKTPEMGIQIIILSILLGVFGFVFPYARKKQLKRIFNNPRIEKRPRKNFTEEQQLIARQRQNGKCLRCYRYPPVWEYHHRDGRNWNNETANCEAICPNCHAKLERGLD